MNHVIETKENVKDLGIYMSRHGNFDFHITKTIAKVRQRMGWIGHAFRTNNIPLRKFMWQNYIGGLLEYNS